MSRRIAGLVVAVIGSLVAAPSVGATVIPVNGFGENATCSLRLAIYDANHDANLAGATCPVGSGNDVITLGAGIYNLSVTGFGEEDDLSGDLDINTSLTIVGQGTGQTEIGWNPSVDDADRDRVLDVHSVDTNPITATISGVDITGGRNPTTESVQFPGTVAGEGAGIRVITGSGLGASTLYLDHSALEANLAINSGSSGGGGITVDTGSTAHLNYVMVGGTSIATTGNFGGPVGGGVLNVGTTTLNKTTVSGNLASAGGGIYNVGTLSAVNSTISSNEAGGTSVSDGGGAVRSSGTLKLSNVTVAENHTSLSGGAGVQVPGGAATLRNSLLGNSFDSGTGSRPDCSGTVTSQGHNLVESNSCVGIGGTDMTGMDPVLGPLQNNGGSLLTQLPGATSPAVNAVPAANCSDIDLNTLTDDERGMARPQPAGGDCDAGAVERDVTPPNTTITSGPSGSTNDPTPTFAFNTAEANSTFQCKLDAGSFGSCASPKTLAHLDDGNHTFSVRAVDRDGNPDPTPATRTINVGTAAVSVTGSNLAITAAVRAKDNLVITRPSPSKFRVTDLPSGPYTGSGVHVGAGCTRVGDYTATCDAAGITLIPVISADMTDKVANSTGVASSLNGGGANDMLIGGAGADTLIGGPGSDVMKGMNGNDSLKARDGASDKAISCDGGTTPGKSDRADMDALPKDSAVAGCEHQIRH